MLMELVAMYALVWVVGLTAVFYVIGYFSTSVAAYTSGIIWTLGLLAWIAERN